MDHPSSEGKAPQEARDFLDGDDERRSSVIDETLDREHNLHNDDDDKPEGSGKASLTTEETRKDVLYSIFCQDHNARRSKVYRFMENPFVAFEEPVIHEIDKLPPPSTVIEVEISVQGEGSPRDWEPVVPVWTPEPVVIERRRRRNSYSSEDSRDSYSSHLEADGEARGEKVITQEPAGYEVHGWELPGSFRPSRVTVTSIRIVSRKLLDLFRFAVQNYPGYSLAGNRIVSNHPFGMLAHYYKELQSIKDGKTDVWSEEFCEGSPEEKKSRITAMERLLDEATLYDLNVLLDYFRPLYTKDFGAENIRHSLGFASFDLLWFLFKPGTNVYAKSGGKIAGFIFEGGEYKSRKGDYWWEAWCWNLSYNGKRIERMWHIFKLKKFRGEKKITSLPVFPSSCMDYVDGGMVKERLCNLGEKYYKMLRAIPAHQYYQGICWDLEATATGTSRSIRRQKPNTEYTGEIVIDWTPLKRQRRRRGDGEVIEIERPSDYDDSESEGDNSRGSIILDPKCSRSDFRNFSPNEYSELSSHHYFLLPRRLTGYAIGQKERMDFDVEYVEPIKWPPIEKNPMDPLIMEDSDKDVLRALTRKYAKGDGTWGADFTEGKGEGQIFLLHGPPGTGKTFTVECVAKYTRRPLLRLTVADIGTSEREMEDILGGWFQRGANWGAIILIDEADVFLEKRQVKDLQRNSLVSVFLSCMEYYTGMLFLTTNRIGQIDDAFLSRISVALTYKTLDIGKQRRIWEGFLKKLAEERKDITLTDRARKFVECLDKDETTKDVPWNGREIRNALQTAIALASYDAEKDAEEVGTRTGRILVHPHHFQAVVDRRKEFIEYRKSIRNQDEDARAYVEGSRAPPSKK